MSTVSFADHMPNLLHSKEVQSEYSFFDIAKLKLFAGPNIWKYTNLLLTAATMAAGTSTIRQQQAPALRSKVNPLDGLPAGSIGHKRHVRVDLFHSIPMDELMSSSISSRDRKAMGTSQSALLLRMREKNLNQMQMARKLRPLTDLTNSHHFPELNFERLARRTEPSAAREHEDFDDHDFANDMSHHDDEGSYPSSSDPSNRSHSLF